MEMLDIDLLITLTFSNQPDLGSAPIEAATAKAREPAREGFISMTGTIFYTPVVCLIKGTVLIVTDSWTEN